MKGCPLVGLIPRKCKKNLQYLLCLGERLMQVIFVKTVIFLETPSLSNFNRIFLHSPKRSVKDV
jgi:hypothetical protein